jgi:hypothetical protein
VETLNFMLVWLGVSAIPYAMYLVAFVFESRKPGIGPNDVPVWKDQSRAFMPGDFGLALAATSAIFMNGATPDWSSEWWWLTLSLFAGYSAFMLGRRFFYSEKDYTKQQWNSPSKRWHDFVMFFGFTFVATALLVPKLIVGFGEPNPILSATFSLGMLVWGVGVVYDTVTGHVPNPRQHPSEWKPIWKKKEV